MRADEYTRISNLAGQDAFLFSRTGAGAGTYNGTLSALRANVGNVYGSMLYVSPSGDDTLATRNSITNPYRTLSAAKAAAVSGDTIWVGAGDYTGYNLLKDNVNWYFNNGARVSYQTDYSHMYSIFDDRDYPLGLTASIDGYGTFLATSVLNGVDQQGDGTFHGVLTTLRPNTVISFRAKEASAGSFNTSEVFSAINAISGKYIDCEVEQMFDIYTGQSRFLDDEFTEVSSQSNGVYWERPREIYFKGHQIITNGYCVYGLEPADGEPDNNFTDAWITCDYIRGASNNAPTYSAVRSPNHRSWEHYTEVVCGGLGFNYLGGGKHYVRADKISSKSNNPVFQINGSGMLWANIQKITHDASSIFGGSAIVQVGGTSKSWLDILHLEDNFGVNALIKCDGGEHHMNIQYGKANSGYGVLHNGGKLELHGMRIVSSGGPNYLPVYAAGTGLVLRNCVLVGASGSRSISGVAGRVVKNYGSYANLSGWTGVSIQVSPLVVDANVN